MRISGLAALMMMAAPIWAAASDDDCTARWLTAEEAGIVLGVATMNGMPTAGVDRDVWNSVDHNTRAGLMATFICAVAGPGKTLMEAQLIDGQGIKLATWKNGTFEVLR